MGAAAKDVHAAGEHLYHDQDPDTLTSRNNLAGAYESAGRLDQAIALYNGDYHRPLGATDQQGQLLLCASTPAAKLLTVAHTLHHLGAVLSTLIDGGRDR